jgi:hypothetical protein
MTLREIVEENAVSAAIDAASAKYARAEEVFDGWKWRLSRDPDIGYPVPGTSPQLFVLRTDNLTYAGVPIFLIAYTYTDTQVRILAVTVPPAAA